MNIKNKSFQYTQVWLIYCLLSVLLTWPLILNMRTSLFGDYGDTRVAVWGGWHNNNYASTQTRGQLFEAPFEVPDVRTVSQPISEYAINIPAHFIGEVTSYNLFVLLSFPLTAFATYLLLFFLLRNRIAAFVGGLIFGFCPGAVMQAVGGHLSFTQNMFIPLFLLALFYNGDKRSLLSAFFVALSYAFLTLNSLYFGYFAIFIALSYILFDYVTHQNCNIKQFSFNYLFIAGIAIVLIVLFQYKIILHQLTTSSANLGKAGHVRDFADLVSFSARPLEYLLPSIDHPVLGQFVEHYARKHLHESNIPEQTLYLGLVPVLIAFSGLFLWKKKDSGSPLQNYFFFFAVNALMMLFLSMPPFIKFGTIQLPTISFFAYKIAPMFRVYARTGILANFFVACAAATVLTGVSGRIQKRPYYVLIGLLVPLLLFEYWSVAPNHALPVDKPPEVYSWLSQQEGDFIIAEYPMTSGVEPSFYTYLFWQRIHRKRLVNGAIPDNTRAWEFFLRVSDLTDPETPKKLKAKGVKYLVLHTAMYREGVIPWPLKRYFAPETSAVTYNMNETYVDDVLGKPYKTFGQDLVFLL